MDARIRRLIDSSSSPLSLNIVMTVGGLTFKNAGCVTDTACVKRHVHNFALHLWKPSNIRVITHKGGVGACIIAATITLVTGF